MKQTLIILAVLLFPLVSLLIAAYMAINGLSCWGWFFGLSALTAFSANQNKQ